MTGTSRRWLSTGGAILGAAVLFEVLAIVPASRWAGVVVEWMRHAGTLGVVVFAVVYVAAAVFMLPGSVLTAGAGLAFGTWRGLLIVSPVSVLAASVAFFAGRTLARPWVERRLANMPTVHAIDAAIGDSGWRLVLMLRLSPLLPFNLLNYALSLTRVSFGEYVAGSFLGMLPGTLLYVSIGAAVADLAALSTRTPSPIERAFFWTGLAVTIGLTAYVTRLARRALATTLESR